MTVNEYLNEDFLCRLTDVTRSGTIEEELLNQCHDYRFFAILGDNHISSMKNDSGGITYPVNSRLVLNIHYQKEEDKNGKLEELRETYIKQNYFAGCIHTGLRGVYSSFFEAYETYYVNKYYSRAVCFEEISKLDVKVSKPVKMIQLERLIHNSMVYKEGRGVLPLIEQWFDICEEQNYNLLNIKCDLVMLYANIKNVIFDFYTLRHQRIKIGVEVFEIVNISTIPDLKQWFFVWLNYTLTNFMPVQASRRFHISEVLEFLEDHLLEDCSLDTVATRFLVSSSYLSRRFTAEIGQTFLGYLTAKKMEKARELLENNHKVSETAEKLGYRDLHHFRKLFKKHHGVTPSQVKC